MSSRADRLLEIIVIDDRPEKARMAKKRFSVFASDALKL